MAIFARANKCTVLILGHCGIDPSATAVRPRKTRCGPCWRESDAPQFG